MPPARYRGGEPLVLALTVGQPIASAVLHFRHVNQAERWQTVRMTAGMEPAGGRYAAAVPEEYTLEPYPVQYYFEISLTSAAATLFPGLGADLAGQPYYVVRRG